jgi:hypothetical protein
MECNSGEYEINQTFTIEQGDDVLKYFRVEIRVKDNEGDYVVEEEVGTSTDTNAVDFFHLKLEKANVPYYSLISQMEKEGITEEEMFFVTDHHWKPEYALWAANKVADELNARFGYEYDEEKLNIDNYNVEIHFNAFLGSQGKKTGKY